LTELKEALDGDEKKKKIFGILDKIIEDKNELPRFEEIKKTQTPDFNYNNLQKEAMMYGIPPRDFEAYIPILKILKLENYDRGDFDNFNMTESLKVLRKLWKTVE